MRLEEECRGQVKTANQKLDDCKAHLRQEQLHLYKCHVRYRETLMGFLDKRIVPPILRPDQ
jgi:hypothetical protein